MRALPDHVNALTSRQDGVVSRRQLLAAGASPNDVRSWLRHRLLAAVHPGVYVDHTGEPTWQQRAWAAVLWAWPAALWGPSVLHLLGADGRAPVPPAVHVVVDTRRTLTAPDGVLVRRREHLHGRARARPGPPHMLLEEAVVDAAAEATDDHAAIAVVAAALTSRRTSATRIRAALIARTRVSRRRLLLDVLADLEAGACSVLEHRYLVEVERAHGLPVADRQVCSSVRGTIFRDVEYPGLGVVVELDGRLDHTEVADRDRDLERDLDATLDGRVTVRLGHGQVLRSCRTAARLSRLLRDRGWEGRMRRCPRCPQAVGSCA